PVKAARGLLGEFRSGTGLKGQLLRGGVGSVAVKIGSTLLNVMLAIVSPARSGWRVSGVIPSFSRGSPSIPYSRGRSLPMPSRPHARGGGFRGLFLRCRADHHHGHTRADGPAQSRGARNGQSPGWAPSSPVPIGHL